MPTKLSSTGAACTLLFTACLARPGQDEPSSSTTAIDPTTTSTPSKDSTETTESAEDSSSSTSSTDTSTEESTNESTATDESTATTSTPPCTENIDNCCGNAKTENNEECDNGTNTDPPHSPGKPSDDPCGPNCKKVSWCGDGVKDNLYEECDNGENTDEYSSSMPEDGACAPECRSVEWCGDGTKNGPEQCDHGNKTDNDGCSSACQIECLVFVTDATFKGDLNGLDGNTHCQEAAKDKLWGTYAAWLSTSELDAKDNTEGCSGPFILRDGTEISMDPMSFTQNHLGIALNEDGDTPKDPPKVWTGTLIGGTFKMSETCADWKSNKIADNGLIGDSQSLSVNNNDWTDDGAESCNNDFHLYCVQTAKNMP
jgi:cysteine-rich repeat protein